MRRVRACGTHRRTTKDHVDDTLPSRAEKGGGPSTSRLLIARSGAVQERNDAMGWSLWLEESDGTVCETIHDHNYTHNTNQMIRDAGDGTSPYDWDGMPSADLAVLLDRICNELEARPDVYDGLNPSNGWGTRETLVPVLQAIAHDCREYPETTVRTNC